jgi:hypothetical protein
MRTAVGGDRAMGAVARPGRGLGTFGSPLRSRWRFSRSCADEASGLSPPQHETAVRRVGFNSASPDQRNVWAFCPKFRQKHLPARRPRRNMHIASH